uniref:Uncharacterized protein n=1 Tax=Daphnia magna TaxID=35525 RepID=A0A0P6GWK2_9CRUS
METGAQLLSTYASRIVFKRARSATDTLLKGQHQENERLAAGKNHLTLCLLDNLVKQIFLLKFIFGSR